MTQKSTPRRPRPVAVDPLRAYARRGPDEEGRYYWQVVRHEGEKQHSVEGASRWGNREEIGHHLAVLVAAGLAGGKRDTLLSVDDLLLDWLEAQKERRDLKRLKPSTYTTYRRLTDVLRAALGAVPLRAINPERLQTWINDEQRAGYAGSTIALHLSTLGCAWRWAHKREKISRAFPNLDLDLPVCAPVYNHYTPTAAEIETTISAILGLRWRVVGEMLWATGARISEVTELLPEQVDLGRGRVTLDGKTGPRTVPIPAALQTAIAPFVRTGLRPLWGQGEEESEGRKSFRHALDAALLRVKGARWSPHAIRRRCATRLIAAGVDPKTYTALMGHSYEIGLKIYASVEGERLETAAQILGRDGRDVILYKPPVQPAAAQDEAAREKTFPALDGEPVIH